MQIGTHRFPRQERVEYGRNALDALMDDAREAGWSRAFLMTSRSVAQSDYYKALAMALGSKLAGQYTTVSAHSPIGEIVEAARHASACGADQIIAIGGGSAIDTAKMVQTCVGQDHVSADEAALRELVSGFCSRTVTGGFGMIAIPTTLSAAEFTHVAGITDPKTGIKHIFDARALTPRIVILDPAATLATPLKLLLGTGVRALDHCVETLCSARPSAFGNAMATEGLSLLLPAMRQIRTTPENLALRSDCQIGAWMAISGPVSGVPVGASHAIGRVLGGAFGVAHGETSCVMLPATLRWNLLAGEDAQRRLLKLIGGEGLTAAEVIAAIIADLGLPGSLSALGIGRESFDVIAEHSIVMLQRPELQGNARSVESIADVRAILELAA